MPRMSKKLADHLGSVVAERALKSSSGDRVIVRIGLPRVSGRDWECPFAITEPGKALLKTAPGVDSMQAVQLAFAGIRSALAARTGPAVHWFANSEMLGFPRQVPEDFGPALEAQVERLIELASLRLAVQGRRRSTKALKLDDRKRPMTKVQVVVDDDLLRRLRGMAKDSGRSLKQVASDLLASIAADDEHYAAVTAYHARAAKRSARRGTPVVEKRRGAKGT